MSKIVGGVATEANEYPWQVGLISSQSSSRPFCGGSLISDREILTAAHCTQSPVGWVTLAEHDITKADGEIKAQVQTHLNTQIQIADLKINTKITELLRKLCSSSPLPFILVENNH